MFKPFRDEMQDIHVQDVKQVLTASEELIERKRSIFEK
jgi:hypothetical protein